MPEPVPEVEIPIVAGKRVRVSADQVADLLTVARDVVEQSVEDGSGCDDPSLACLCYVCRALRILVALEGPGRCAICGCDEEHACFTGCGWADDARTVCDRHPPEDIVTARLVLAADQETAG